MAVGRRSLLASLPRLLLVALRDAARRPTVVALLLLLNLGVALLVAAPVRSLLSAELDDNLYGEVMEDGASWRWFDTVERQHPQAVGDYSPWTALFSSDGVGLEELAAVSGPAAMLLLAALLLFLLQAPLHVGYLAAGRQGARAVVSAGLASALAAVALAVVAALAYAGAYALLFVAPAALLERYAEFLHSEPIHLVFTWLRLGLTLLALLSLKVFFDLAKLGLAQRAGELGERPALGEGSTGLGDLHHLPAALALAVRETLRRGWAYVTLDLLLVMVVALLGLFWWWLSAPLVPATWLGLAILFVLHQLFLALRIGLRLAQLDATRGIHGWPSSAPRESHPEDEQAEEHAVEDEGRHGLAPQPGEERADDEVGRHRGDD